MALDRTLNIQKYYAYSGSTSRVLEVDSTGLLSANKQFVVGKLSDTNAIAKLTGNTWSGNGVYTGATITNTYEGQYYYYNQYSYFAHADNFWLRTPRNASTINGIGNGLTLTNGNVILGGTLTGNTNINLNNKEFDFNDTFTIIGFSGGTGFNGNVNSILLQSDNKILLGGEFTSYNDNTYNRIIRLNSDGSIDNTFSIGTGFNYTINSIILQSDNKILVGGAFTSYSGITKNLIIRLNTNGSIDNTFNIGTGFDSGIRSIAIQSDGKIVCGGWFTTYSGTTSNYIIRLNSNGSIDNTFNIGTGFDSGINCIIIQSDNKILVGGEFTSYSGVSKNGIIRLNTNGSIDNTFSIGTGFDITAIKTIALQSDGKILVGGYFNSYNGTASNYIIRLYV